MPFTSGDPLAQAAGAVGGYVRAWRYGSEELTGPARKGFMQRFRTQVDPDGTLDPVERERRAVAALHAHMRRIRLNGTRKAVQS